MNNIVGKKGWSDRIKLFKLILTEFDNNWPITANFNRLITESLFAKQIA
jgi:hypothetical protein